MKRLILSTLLILAFGVQNHTQAQFKNTQLAWGLAAGGAHGSNIGSDKWVMQYRGFLQYGLISPLLAAQLGVGYSELSAPGVYSAQTGMADVRLLLSPFMLANVSPYAYAGIGVSKALNFDGSSYLMMVPMGAGVQTRLSSNLSLEVSGGYTLSLSDELDGRVRTDTDLNSLTNGKNDGFYGFTVGVVFALGRGEQEAEQAKKKELAEAEAVRARQQAAADAEAKRVKQASDLEAQRAKEAADAEARRLKELSDAEAQRVKQQTDAQAEAMRVKQQTEAEARRVKDSSDAVARRLAEQQARNAKPVIVLEKGKKVVLKGINFETNKATLRKDSETILQIAYDALVANPSVQIEISGHTDNVGSEKANQTLSLQRAQAVRNWLVRKGIASNRLKAVGKGFAEPVATNDTAEGRSENRRIEFYVQQ